MHSFFLYSVCFKYAFLWYIKRATAQISTGMHGCLHVQYMLKLSELNVTENSPVLNFVGILPAVLELLHVCRQKNGWTDWAPTGLGTRSEISCICALQSTSMNRDHNNNNFVMACLTSNMLWGSQNMFINLRTWCYCNCKQ